MKYFISYRHTGAKEPRLGDLQKAIKEAFDKRPNDNFYSTYFNQQDFTNGEDWPAVMNQTLKFIESFDVILVILDSDIKSEGMLIEVGYCLALNKPIIIAKNNSVKDTYFQDLANQRIDFNSLEELKQELISL